MDDDCEPLVVKLLHRTATACVSGAVIVLRLLTGASTLHCVVVHAVADLVRWGRLYV